MRLDIFLRRLHNILYVKYSTISIPQFRPHDVCVSAPTGSGKTLAFVLPIVQALRNRVVPRVRALVVLPVQDLATQVYKVFLQYAEVGIPTLSYKNTPMKYMYKYFLAAAHIFRQKLSSDSLTISRLLKFIF